MRKCAKQLQELHRKNSLSEHNKCDFDKNLKDWAQEEFKKRFYRNES